MHHSSQRRLVVVLFAAVALSAAPDLAVADDEAYVSPVAWGVASLELSGAGYLALRFGAEVVPDDGVGALAANLTPALIGAGAAFAAYHNELDPRPALAAHGAFWGGLDLFLLGMMIDGRDEAEGLRVGKASWILGTVGAIGGGVLGATAGDRWQRGWLTAPSVGLLGGTVIGGVLVLASGDMGGNKSVRNFAIGAVAGMTISLATAAIIGYLRDDDDGAAARDAPGLVPQVEPGPRRVVFSLGGSF